MLLPKLDAIRDVAHVTDHDPIRLLLDRHVDHRAANLVLHVAHHAPVLGPHPAPGLFQPPFSTAAFLLPAKCLAQFGKPFGVALLLMPPLPTADAGGLLPLAHPPRMDLTKINCDDVCSWPGFWLSAIFDYQMPGIATSAPVVDQTHLQDTQHIAQVRGQRDTDSGVSFGPREENGVASATDAALLPDRGAPVFAFVRIVRTLLAVCPGGRAGFIEALLRGIL